MISYTHRTHSRSRTIKIKVESDGKVVVVTPPRISTKKIDNFVKQSEQWIKKSLAKVKKRSSFGVTDKQVMIFGKKYTRKVDYSSSSHSGVFLKNNALIINPLSDPSLISEGKLKKNTQSQLDNFLKNTASKYIVPRLNQLAKKMKIKFNKVTLRQQKTRWGSCSSKGNLNFNWRLIHCPTKVIDYVIIHELSHRVHLNHSHKFWELVSKYDPEHRTHSGWLKRHGVALS